jgi:dUTPase
VARVEPSEFRPVEELPPTSRGAGGFGSTGLGG